MRQYILLLLTLIAPLAALAQKQKITLISTSLADETYYIGQHFRDKILICDSAQARNGSLTFDCSAKKLARGVYVLADSKRKKLFDFVVDDSRKFQITFDSNHTNLGMRVKGSAANSHMFEYLAAIDRAQAYNKQQRALLGNASPTLREQINHRLDSLEKAMIRHERAFVASHRHELFAELLSNFGTLEIPSTLPPSVKNQTLGNWQAQYFTRHYWDSVDLSNHNLILTPHLFDKTNYFFFGLLYYQDSDTTTHYVFDLLDRVSNDSTMLRYFLDFITPRYQNSTRHIGWDQVFVNIVKRYYLAGKCPWATEAELINKRQTVNFLAHSLIGAHGAELLMADTNQSPNPRDWISSHRFPEPYVVLWFWDPDCNHCRQQTAELQHLYDSLKVAGSKPFEVYAVGYESDVQKWINYVRQHHLPFVNVGGPNVNVDYQEVYNVHGAPTMIILDRNRDIIMNKTIPISQLMPFIEEHERKIGLGKQ